LSFPALVFANKPVFQDFVFQACLNATGDLSTRCSDSNNGTDDGDLSGDSEDSLIPTQSLTNTTNALAQTRARIKALMEKARERANAQQTGILDEATGTRAITEAFQQTGYSLLLQAEYGDLDRDESELERGYETESYLFKIGADYRIADDFLVGALVGIDRYDQTFDADLPGVNFVPQANEGDSEVSNVSLNVFATKNFADAGYLEAQLSYIYTDYEFNRSVVFQDSGRSTLTNVNTDADTNGYQWAFSLGGGYEFASGPWSSGLYGRADFQKVVIDDYSESGGNGFAMNFEKESNNEVTGTFGARISRAINQDFGVLVPQAYIEHVHAFKADARTTVSSLIEDTAGTRFSVTGDDPDEDYQNVGVSLMAILPDGINAFLGYSTQLNNRYVDYYRVNAGLRIEL
jgi:uncharacterized protein YhjY with autotransporter beta-barrel domain